MNDPIYQFMAGAICVMFYIVALFFWQFYRKIGDRFFLLFSISFHIFAVERCALVLLSISDESRSFLYMVRFIAFVIILIAIIDKNRKS